MTLDAATVIRTVDAQLAAGQLEEAEARQRQLLAVQTKRATGTGDIAHTFALDKRFRLVFVRCHFSGTSGTAAFALSIDSGSGAAYDARLFTITQAGLGKDVNLRIGDGDVDDPSAWTFQPGDAIRIDWENPDGGNITWGLEVGLAAAA
jgi:hypothetical protein